MEQLARRILESFDGSGGDALELHVLAERAGAATPAERDALRAALAQLVQQGLLRSADGDAFARTEDGRLAVAGPLDVTLSTRARAVISAMKQRNRWLRCSGNSEPGCAW